MSTKNGKGKPDIKKMLRQAKLPETTVPVCLRGDLQAEFERLDRALSSDEQQRDDSLAGDGGRAVAEQIEALRAEMRGHTVDFRLRAMKRPDWRELMNAHPPRRAEDGSVDDRDKFVGVNVETFFAAMVRACVVEPELDEEDWTLLLDEALTDRQFNELSDAAWMLNRGQVKIPFSPAASKILRSDSE